MAEVLALSQFSDAPPQGRVPIPEPQPNVAAIDGAAPAIEIAPEPEILNINDFTITPEYEKIGIEGRVVQAPVGLKGREVTFLHDTQNKGANPEDYFAGIKLNKQDMQSNFTEDLVKFARRSDFAPDTRESVIRGVDAGARRIATGVNSVIEQVSEKFAPLMLNKTMANMFGERAQRINENANRLIAVNQKKINDLQSKSPNKTVFNIAGVVPSIAGAIGTTYVTRNPYAAASLFGSVQQGNIYVEGRQAGLADEDATSAANIAGLLEGGIEVIGGKVALSIFKESNFFKRVAEGFVNEGTQEALQSGAEAGVTNVANIRDDTVQKVLGDMAEAFIIGGAVGGPITGIFNTSNHGNLASDLQKNYDLSEGDAQVLANNIIAGKSELADVIEDMVGGAINPLLNPLEPQKQTQEIVQAFQEGVLDSSLYTAQRDLGFGHKEAFEVATAAGKAAQANNTGIDKGESVSMALPSNPAKLIGRPLNVFHGSNSKFTTFDDSKVGQYDDGLFGFGHYFSGDEAVAKEYGDNITTQSVEVKNPYIVRDVERDWRNAEWSNGKRSGKDLAELLKQRGYDGVIWAWGDAPGQYDVMAISGKQIKSPIQAPQPNPVIANLGESYQAVANEVSPGIVSRMADTVKTRSGQFAKGLDKALTPISTRLKNISPKLSAGLRNYEFEANNARNRDERRNEGFFQKFGRIDPVEARVLDFAMQNRDIAVINEIAKRNGMEKEIAELRATFEETRNRQIAVGFKIGKIDNYFPRVVKEPEGLLDYLEKREDWDIFKKAIQDAEDMAGRQLSVSEKARVIDETLSEVPDSKKKDITPTSGKQRKIEVITPEMRQFYYSTPEAIDRYFAGTNEAIAAAKFLGADKAELETNLEATIGRLVLEEWTAGRITPSQAKELQGILSARFQQGQMNEVWAALKNSTLILTMGSPTSAIRQLGDLSLSLYRNGFFKTGVSFGRSLTGRSEIKTQDIGVDNILQEFKDKTLSSRFVNGVFTLNGLRTIDRLGKHTLMNASLSRFRQAAKNPTAGFRNQMETIFGAETDAVIKDLQSGEITDNVGKLIFHDLLENQPVALSEMPEYYLRHPNVRVFYTLKSYTLKVLDIYRNEVINQMRDQPVQALKNFTRLTSLLAIGGATTAEIIGFILGETVDFGDEVITAILSIGGFNNYDALTYKKDGPGELVLKKIAPPVALVDTIGELLSGDEKVIKRIPIVGKIAYSWYGAENKPTNGKIKRVGDISTSNAKIKRKEND